MASKPFSGARPARLIQRTRRFITIKNSVYESPQRSVITGPPFKWAIMASCGVLEAPHATAQSRRIFIHPLEKVEAPVVAWAS